ncbi:hypothetical protein E2C01_036364 [Portunus trituberculatus]|uniref:Uncharacterized protein n=1 Tax=Portunus trituberculatus TaxID=210409 RepID=A0A5B7FE00_PORTR|nr:hypothetical protein [Portunus trituberculatus]
MWSPLPKQRHCQYHWCGVEELPQYYTKADNRCEVNVSSEPRTGATQRRVREQDTMACKVKVAVTLASKGRRDETEVAL